MEAKEFLNQLKKLDFKISNKMIEYEQMMAIATGTTSQMGSERVQSSGSQQKMADWVVKAITIQEETNNIIDTLIDTRQDVISVIEQLNALEYDVMHKRYVQYMEFKEIGKAHRKNESWATTVHGRALANVQRILDGRKV